MWGTRPGLLRTYDGIELKERPFSIIIIRKDDLLSYFVERLQGQERKTKDEKYRKRE